MKELSIKEKAKRYDEAVKVAKYYYDEGKTLEYANDIVSDIFPELKESEDEKTRKELYDFCMKCSKGGTLVNQQSDFQRWATWLEKQGEQNPNNNNQFTSEQADILDKHIDNFLGQKPAYKVEPKFRIGDYLVNDYCKGKVIALTDDAYLLDTEQGIPFSCEHNAHLWTIQDAKDGDVLACGDKVTDCPFIFHNLNEELNPRSYCGVNTLHHFQYNDENGGCWYHHSDEIRPATKEQRDLLFQKMKEAGYEWDDEKKKLKKIKDKPLVIDEGKDEMDYCFTKMMNGEKINPAWNEEDERLCKCIIKDQEEALDDVRNDKYGHSEIISDLKDMYRERIDWLKSLKERMKGE